MPKPTLPPSDHAVLTNGGAAQSAPEIRRVAFVSLGCPKNLIDSEKMLGLLAEDGIEPTSDPADADAIVVNTCGFVEAAKEESLEVIREAAERKERGELSRIIVAGCLVQRHRAKMLEWCPDIDSLIGVYDRDHIVQAVRGSAPDRPTLDSQEEKPNYWIATNALAAAKNRGMKTTGLTVRGDDGKGLGYFESDASRLRLTPRHYAYLRISEGCNQHCTFCTIPSIRGKMRSKPIDVIQNEMRELLSDGAFEINLIGQDTTSFGYDVGYQEGLAGLLRGINGVAAEHGGAWLRLMYAYPSYFTDEMIDAIAASDHVLKYIDMPLQHINDRVLDSMERHTSRDLIETLLNKLRERIPAIAIRTTFITGFPGETEEEHQELLEFVESFGFDNMGVFQYSPEPGTKAFQLEQEPGLRIPDEVKARRFDELMSLQQEVAFDQMDYLASFYQSEDESTEPLQFDVLIDRATESESIATTGVHTDDEQLYVGRTYFQAPSIDASTYVQSRHRLSPGELVRCTIVDSDGYDLIAQPTEDLEKRTSLTVLS